MRAANKKGYRDVVMSTDGISLNIVENSTSDKLSKGDLRKAWGGGGGGGGLERRWNPKTREEKIEFYTHQLPKIGKCQTEANGLVGLPKKEKN